MTSQPSPTAGKRKDPSLKFLTRDEVRRLLKGPLEACQERDYYLLALTYILGLRGGEVVLLRPEHFHAEHVLVPTLKKKSSAAGYPRCQMTNLPLVPVPILWSANVVRAAREWAGPRRIWMFPSGMNSTSHMSTRTYRTTFRRWSAVAGLHPDISAHSLRHSAGSHIQEAVKDVVLIRDFLRHSNVSITSTYLHTTKSSMDDARAKIRRLHHASRG